VCWCGGKGGWKAWPTCEAWDAAGHHSWVGGAGSFQQHCARTNWCHFAAACSPAEIIKSQAPACRAYDTVASSSQQTWDQAKQAAQESWEATKDKSGEVGGWQCVGVCGTFEWQRGEMHAITAVQSTDQPTSPTATCLLAPLVQTWDDASRAAWDSWMSARNYAGGNWKDTQRAAEQYWRDTKGGWVGWGEVWVGARACRQAAWWVAWPCAALVPSCHSTGPPTATELLNLFSTSHLRLQAAGRTQEGYDDFMSGVWSNYGAARDSAGWTWNDAQKAARDYWGATKSRTKQTWDQVGGLMGSACMEESGGSSTCVAKSASMQARACMHAIICMSVTLLAYHVRSLRLLQFIPHSALPVLPTCCRPAMLRGPTGCAPALPPAPAGTSCRWVGKLCCPQPFPSAVAVGCLSSAVLYAACACRRARWHALRHSSFGAHPCSLCCSLCRSPRPSLP
jgi:hypothetical protein